MNNCGKKMLIQLRAVLNMIVFMISAQKKGLTESAFMNKMYARIIWESLGNVI